MKYISEKKKRTMMNKNNLFKKISYKHRVASVILIFTLLPCILLGNIYLNSAKQNWKKSALAPYQSSVDSCALLMSKIITGQLSKIEYLRNNSSARSAISQINDISLTEALDLIYTLNELVGSITSDNTALSVRWYPHLSTRNYGSYCYTLESFSNEFQLSYSDPLFQQITALDEGQILWVTRNISREINHKGIPEPYLCLYTQMTNLNGSNCILEFSIPVSKMLESKNYASVPDSVFAICMLQNDEPIDILLDSTCTETRTELLIEQYRQAKLFSDYEILHAPIPNVPNSEVIFALPTTYVNTMISPQIIQFTIISLIFLLIIIVVSFLASHLLTKQIIIENLRMELELLQMRFNPHLLYNTLASIRHQVKNPMARNSIDSLCHYYRIILNNGHLFIRISDEIDMIKEYLSIEKFAYQLDNISFEFEIDKDIVDCKIIKHLLQPIVENALHHGIRSAGQDHDGLLKIHAFSNNDYIFIKISDNGVGMSSEEITKLLTPPSASTTEHGYGFYNVNQRIQVYYGNDYGLQVNSIIDKGTIVTLKLPAKPTSSE